MEKRKSINRSLSIKSAVNTVRKATIDKIGDKELDLTERTATQMAISLGLKKNQRVKLTVSGQFNVNWFAVSIRLLTNDWSPIITSFSDLLKMSLLIEQKEKDTSEFTPSNKRDSHFFNKQFSYRKINE